MSGFSGSVVIQNTVLSTKNTGLKKYPDLVTDDSVYLHHNKQNN